MTMKSWILPVWSSSPHSGSVPLKQGSKFLTVPSKLKDCIFPFTVLWYCKQPETIFHWMPQYWAKKQKLFASRKYPEIYVSKYKTKGSISNHKDCAASYNTSFGGLKIRIL